MTKYLNVREERRGIRNMFVGAVIAVFVVAGATIVWPWLTSAPSTSTNGPRTDQTQGASTLARRTTAPPSAATDATTPATVGRNEGIEASANENLDLNTNQRKAVNVFASQHAQQKTDLVDFTIAVGAAVPQKVTLGDIPVTLSDALSAYSGDRYFIVPNQFVIVEKSTRRIVAIIPVAA